MFLLGEGNGTPLHWHPTGESHGQRSLVGYSPWGHQELDTTEQLHFLSLLNQVMASAPINSWEIDGETVSDIFFGRGPPKSLQIEIAVMKLKDAYFLEGKL